MDQTTGNVVATADGQQAQETTQNQTTTQASNERTFTQSELDNIITKRLAQFEKKYSNVDVNEYQELKALKEQQETEAAIKRQDFEKVLTNVKSAAEQKISALQRELETIKIDGALIAEASSRKAVAPDKVAALLRSQLKLAQDGKVEVVDSQGNVRYNADSATPLGLGDLVDEFLKANSFFVAAGPAGSGSRNAGQETSTTNVDLASLDMKKAEHRELYRKMKAQQAN